MSVMTRFIAPAAERRGEMPGRPAVPWATVLPLAVLMAYADGFWLTSLRGAVGAIERTQEPFATWLRSRYFRPIRTFRDPGHHRFPVMAMPQFAQPDHHNLLICVHYSACCQVSSSHAANPVSPPRTCPSESAFVEAGLCVPVRYRRANK